MAPKRKVALVASEKEAVEDAAVASKKSKVIDSGSPMRVVIEHCKSWLVTVIMQYNYPTFLTFLLT